MISTQWGNDVFNRGTSVADFIGTGTISMGGNDNYFYSLVLGDTGQTSSITSSGGFVASILEVGSGTLVMSGNNFFIQDAPDGTNVLIMDPNATITGNLTQMYLSVPSGETWTVEGAIIP